MLLKKYKLMQKKPQKMNVSQNYILLVDENKKL